MLIRHIEKVSLEKITKQKQENGSYLESFQKIKDYDIQKQELDDEISASIYGANLVNMLRIKSPLKDLEAYLNTKLNNKTDNISQYYIFINNAKYRIKSVNSKGVTIELV